jgi:hypothetical protein
MHAMLSTAAKVEGSLNRVFISNGWLEARDSWSLFGFALMIACDLFVGVDAHVTRLFLEAIFPSARMRQTRHTRSSAGFAATVAMM